MKYFAPLAALAGIAAAVPTPTEDVLGRYDTRTVEKRAAISDACDIGYASTNGGTNGGNGGTTTTVSSLAEFTNAATSNGKAVIMVNGAISGGAKVKVGSDKSIIGTSNSSLTGVGLTIKAQSNVIIRNMKLSRVLAQNGDAITIQASKNVWVDHCDVSSDLGHGKDYYDGLIDVTHGSEWVTISNTYYHDHYKASLGGHSDGNAVEDTGHLHVTYANNHWENINSRTPSFRFGTGHIFNNLWSGLKDSGVNTRMGAKLLIESSVFENCGVADVIESRDSSKTGTASTNDVDLGGCKNTAPTGSFGSGTLPYQYTTLGSAKVKAEVSKTAGQTLSF